MTAIRPTAVAGMFYPAEPSELRAQVEHFLAQARAARTRDDRQPKALIAPHAGYIYSGPVAASAYVRLAAGTVSRVVLIGPSHRVGFRGLAVTSAEAWASPLGPVPVDREAVARLRALPFVEVLDQAFAAEHSLEVHVPFLQVALGSFTLVPIVAGDARAEEVAAALEAVWGGPETLIVVSTDLSHYLDYAACQAADNRTAQAIQHLDPAGLGRDGACGRVPVSGLLVAARRRAMDIVTLDLRNSGDTAGPRDRVVGYGAWALYAPEAPQDDEIAAAGPTLVELARSAILHGLDTGRPLPVRFEPGMAPILGRPGATFVTLKKAGALRGCIGSALAWRPLIEDVAENAFKAAFGDPRFPALERQEWPEVTLSVSVLTPPVPMDLRGEADLLAKLRPGVDGLIIEDAGRRALFLPSVWEQLPDPRQFLHHLKLKAGMPPGHWSPTFRASRFQAVEVR